MSEGKLTKDNLQTAEAILSLGIVVVKELNDKGMTTIFLNENGEVEMCPVQEVWLDQLNKEQALDVLVEWNYSEEQMMSYLKGRRARGNHIG